jgi:catechol 2,3-dioxygenase-like lactoylglutathione lyase family enzyme
VHRPVPIDSEGMDMAVSALQHLNIRCSNAERSRDFYVAVLGLVEGPRPPFASHGYWLYLGGDPVVHLVQKPEGEAALGPGTGELDHVAFLAHDLDATRRSLAAQAVNFRETIVPRDDVVQILLHDPEGIQIELNFARG